MRTVIPATLFALLALSPPLAAQNVIFVPGGGGVTADVAQDIAVGNGVISIRKIEFDDAAWKVEGRDRECKRCSCVVVPDLGCVDPMPVRTLAARQQKVDRGRGSASACDRVAEGFAEMPALGMRLEREPANYVRGGKGLHRSSLYVYPATRMS